jgi:hypothetical protein
VGKRRSGSQLIISHCAIINIWCGARPKCNVICTPNFHRFPLSQNAMAHPHFPCGEWCVDEIFHVSALPPEKGVIKPPLFLIIAHASMQNNWIIAQLNRAKDELYLVVCSLCLSVFGAAAFIYLINPPYNGDLRLHKWRTLGWMLYFPFATRLKSQPSVILLLLLELAALTRGWHSVEYVVFGWIMRSELIFNTSVVDFKGFCTERVNVFKIWTDFLHIIPIIPNCVINFMFF